MVLNTASCGDLIMTRREQEQEVDTSVCLTTMEDDQSYKDRLVMFSVCTYVHPE